MSALERPAIGEGDGFLSAFWGAGWRGLPALKRVSFTSGTGIGKTTLNVGGKGATFRIGFSRFRDSATYSLREPFNKQSSKFQHTILGPAGKTNHHARRQTRSCRHFTDALRRVRWRTSGSERVVALACGGWTRGGVQVERVEQAKAWFQGAPCLTLGLDVLPEFGLRFVTCRRTCSVSRTSLVETSTPTSPHGCVFVLQNVLLKKAVEVWGVGGGCGSHTIQTSPRFNIATDFGQFVPLLWDRR